jgi:hypothetical protein
VNDTPYPTGKLIDKYIEVRIYIQEKTKEFETHIKTYKQALSDIEIEMLARLDAEGQQSAKSDSGAIAFKQLATHCRVADRDTWLTWLTENWDVGKHMLTAYLTKQAVKDYLETEQKAPAGIEITQTWGVNFRKG